MSKSPKSWSWSYSKLKNFETCPKRHYEIDLAKNYSDTSEALTWGNEVHKAMANACSGAAPLPDQYAMYQPWVDKVRGGPGKLLVEQKYAITEGFTPTTFFAGNAWFRAIADVVRIHDEVAWAPDWKTGAPKDDSVQLALVAQCLFAHFPQLKRIRTEFVWLREGNDCSTPETFNRADMGELWLRLWPRVSAMKQAHDLQSYPPKPDRLCRKWCPVASCPYHRKGPNG